MDTVKLDALKTNLDKAFAERNLKSSVLWSDADTGEVFYARDPDCRVVSASTIKTPLMLALLEEVRRGRLSLEEKVVVPPGAVLGDTTVFDLGQETYPLGELIYWMITVSDNTATNVLMDLAGMDAVNSYTAGLGCRDTLLQRKMLDAEAVRAGRNNYTSARDMELLFRRLHARDILTPALCDWALGVLMGQRIANPFLRYIPGDIPLAHKTGSLEYLSHDCGIFFLPQARFFLGVFLWDTPGVKGDHQLSGLAAKMIYDFYKDA